jgi:anthranilate phosphoribosyltransferase
MPITNTEALTRVIEHREIFHDEMLALMRRIMSGEMSPVMIAALSMGLRVKKETVGEIAAAAQVMREFATPVPVDDRTHLVDIVGTGGDSRTPSTSPRPPSSWRQRRVRAWPNTPGAACRPPAASADVMEALGANIMLARAGGGLPAGDRHRLHVCTQPPRRDAARGPGAQGTGRAHASSTSWAR